MGISASLWGRQIPEECEVQGEVSLGPGVVAFFFFVPFLSFSLKSKASSFYFSHVCETNRLIH